MAAGLGISRRTVFRALARAESDGVLRKLSERDHLGHVVTQRWVLTEIFKAKARKAECHIETPGLVSPDGTRAECHSKQSRVPLETEPSVTETKAECQTAQSRVPSDGTALVKALISTSLIDKSLISRNEIGDVNPADSARDVRDIQDTIFDLTAETARAEAAEYPCSPDVSGAGLDFARLAHRMRSYYESALEPESK